jgi:hypothetical protein
LMEFMRREPHVSVEVTVYESDTTGLLESAGG